MLDAHTATVRDQYDRAGLAYDMQTDRFKRTVAYPAFLSLLAQRTGSLSGLRVLDSGCGSGSLVELLGAQGAYATGIDLSPVSVARGRDRGLPLFVGNQLALPFADATFDAALSFHAFNYVPHDLQRSALLEQLRVLAPSGPLMMACFPLTKPHAEPVEVPMHGERFRLYLRTAAELVALLKSAGCTRVESIDLTCSQDECTLLDSGRMDADEQALIARLREGPYACVVCAQKV